MAGQLLIAVSSFVVDVPVTRYSAVVQGTAAGHAQYAAADNEGTFLGIVNEDKASGLSTSVVIAGLVWAQSGGAIALGDPLIVGATGQVKTAVGITAPNVIGYALEAADAAGENILIHVGGTPQLLAANLLKKITGTTNAVANTQTAYPHGLPYVPTTVLVTCKSNGFIYESAPADATDIYLEGSAASLNFDAYVG